MATSARSVGSGGRLGTPDVGRSSIVRGTSISGGTGIGSTFKSLYSGKPNAAIKRSTVALPGRGEFGSPTSTPGIAGPSRKDYGYVSAAGLGETRAAARKAEAGFNDPRSTEAFQNIMGLAQEQTGRQDAERQRGAADAMQRRGFGGFDDEARAAKQDKMQALATAGFAGAESVRAQEGEQYGRAIGAFTQLQTSYNEAKQAGDIAYAKDLTAVHMQNAENTLKTAGLNMEQQLAYAGALNDAKMLQAKLDQDYNNSLIDNNRFIEGQQQIAAQLQAQQMALEEKRREFDAESAFRDKAFAEQQRQFDLGLKANPNTALRTFDDPRYGGKTGRGQKPLKGSVFTGMS